MAKKVIKEILKLGGLQVGRYDSTREELLKLYDKYRDYTMISPEIFALNLDLVSKYAEVEGDIVECGVWKGGMSAAIAEITGKNKTIHLFDSFEGLPPAKEIDGRSALDWQADTTSKDYYDNCTAEESFAINAMKLAGHKNYHVYKGWFKDTLQGYNNKPISILRLDGDWYDSTMECMNKMFPLVVDGGLIIVDDYYAWDGCSRAIHDYLSGAKSPSRIRTWKDQLCYIIKKN